VILQLQKEMFCFILKIENMQNRFLKLVVLLVGMLISPAFLITLNAQPPVDWAIGMEGQGQGMAAVGAYYGGYNAMVIDAEGNSYIAGSFADTIDLDPGSG